MDAPKVGTVVRVRWLDQRLDIAKYSDVKVERSMGCFLQVTPVGSKTTSWVPVSGIVEFQEILTPETHRELSVSLLQRPHMSERNGYLYVTS